MGEQGAGGEEGEQLLQQDSLGWEKAEGVCALCATDKSRYLHHCVPISLHTVTHCLCSRMLVVCRNIDDVAPRNRGQNFFIVSGSDWP